MRVYTLISLCLWLPIIALAQVQIGADIDGQLPGNRCGTSVSLSMDGTRMAIGAIRADGNGSDAGNVRVFSQSGGTWVQVGADINGETAGDESGRSVSLSADGKRVAIGAASNDDSASNAGQVRIYEENGGSWTQVGMDIDGEATNDISGWAVSLSADGTRVAIGARLNAATGAFGGHVRIYEESGGTWLQVGADIDGEAGGDQSGASVALSEDGKRVAIGASGNDDNGSAAGHVRVYEESGGVWTQVGADIDGEAGGDQSGISVSISYSGTRVAIGAPFNDGNGMNAGHVRIYEESGGTWTQVGADINGEAAGDNSGFSVSLSSDGTRVVIGAPGNGPTDIGQVRFYEEIGGTWTQAGADINGEATDDESGTAVAIAHNGTRVAIGTPFNDGNGTLAGHVRVYGSFPLPVELVSFTAQQRLEEIQLAWLTASERDNRGFEIQKSADARHWETLQFVEGQGSSLTGKHYTLIDPNPYLGLSYYRLKQLDFNGDFTFSELVSVHYEDAAPQLKVFPNPSSGAVQLRYNELLSTGIGTIVISDALGQVIFKDQYDVHTTYRIAPEIFRHPGMYALTLQLGNKSFSQRIFIVEE